MFPTLFEKVGVLFSRALVTSRAPVYAFALAAASLAASAGLLCTSPANAQSVASGTLSGIVLDVSGRPLGGARVTVTGASVARTLQTGSDGRFTLAVPPDTYSVGVSDNGFENAAQEGITVLAGQSASVRFSLANLTLQTIGRTVTSRSTSLNRTPAATASVSSQTFLDQGQDQVVNVLDQIPGVEINRDSSNAPGANTAISIRGAQPYESQVLIDGHPVVTSANGAFGFNATFVNALLLGDIEVDKGPGNLPNTIENAVGGTLNFRTPLITGGPTATLLAGYDSFNGGTLGVRASDTFGKLGVLVGYAENETPGYLAPQTIYGGQLFPKVTAGTAYVPHTGVVDFGYLGTQEFGSRSQLGKISYNFSPQTSLLLEQYSTQTNNDETGTNYQYVDGTIVPCIDTTPAGGLGNCLEAGGTNQNYTNGHNGDLIGQSIPINLYAPYPDTTEFDNEPIYSAEFRTVLGPGSLLARYYTGAINRIITQTFSNADIPCSSPACPTGDNLTENPPYYAAYQGEPYVEDTIDILHGLDAQYALSFGNNAVTLGFDRHVDTATFGEYDPTEGPPSFTQGLNVQSLAYSLRGTFGLTPKLTLQSGNYLSSTTYVGSRFDPRLGLTYREGPNASIRASYGSAYVAPYYQLIQASPSYAQGTLTLPTGTFRPETSSGFDLGADVKPERNTLLSADLYLTNIFNRYASVTTQVQGQSYQGKPVTQITQEGNQALVREEGVEFQVLHAPQVGLGFHSAVDILRDYAYDQDPNAGVDSIFNATPGNYVQLPQYPFSKIRNDLFYSFANGMQTRLSSTSYGANNAFGQPGFTEFDGELRLTLKGSLILNAGCTNVFNHDDYRAGAIYDGGTTYQALGGGTGYGTFFFVQPRTVYLTLQRNLGPSGTAPLPRTSL